MKQRPGSQTRLPVHIKVLFRQEIPVSRTPRRVNIIPCLDSDPAPEARSGERDREGRLKAFICNGTPRREV